MTTYLRQNRAGLYLGTLLCTGPTTDAAGNKFLLRSMADGADWGSAQPIDVAVQRWMTDGAVVFTQGNENRTITFMVKVSADTSVALAAGEDALVTAANGPTTLAWTPPEGSVLAATTVFDVWTCHLAHKFDIDDENRLTRTYQVTATAKPWARSEDLVTVAAVGTSGAPTVTSIDACTSTTGWTGSPNTPTVFGGTAVRESISAVAGAQGQLFTLVLTRTGSVTGLGTQPYIVLDMGMSPAFSPGYLVTVDGATCTKVGQVGTSTYWQVPAGVTSFTTLRVAATVKAYSYNGTIAFDIRDVSKSDKIGGTGSHKMFIRHLDVGGSVPTSGSIQIASPSATILGNTLVYTCPDIGNSYNPAMRSFRTSGNTVTADSSCISGSREPLVTSGASAGGITYQVPAGQLRPGLYVALIRIATSTANATLNVTVSASPVGFGGDINPLVGTIVLDGTPGFYIVGLLPLPYRAKPTESQIADQIFLSAVAASGTTTHTVDDLLLLDITHGSFTLIDGVITGQPTYQFTRLWIDSPDASTDNVPRIYQGSAADRSDALVLDHTFPQIQSLGDHDLDPNGALVITATDGVDDAAVSATFYRRWHTHAAT